MVKKLSKRLLAVLLSLCIVTSLTAVGIVGADAAEADVAATGNPILETITEQLIDDGLRAICMGIDCIGEATGNGQHQSEQYVLPGRLFPRRLHSGRAGCRRYSPSEPAAALRSEHCGSRRRIQRLHGILQHDRERLMPEQVIT